MNNVWSIEHPQPVHVVLDSRKVEIYKVTRESFLAYIRAFLPSAKIELANLSYNGVPLNER